MELVCNSQDLPPLDGVDMEWAVPEHQPEEVDRAGLVVASVNPDSSELSEALSIVDNWRASHHFPLNTFQSTLRRKAGSFQEAVVVQRVKRLRAIQHKLRKHTKKPIRLSDMQDIGGCRVVLKSSAQLKKAPGGVSKKRIETRTSSRR